MIDKTSSLADVVSLIQKGQTLALGGLTIYRRPVAFVRTLIQTVGLKPADSLALTLLTFAAGLESDFLVGAGQVQRTRTCYFGLEIFGLAPMFSQAAAKGTVEIIEESENSIASGIRATMARVGFMPSLAWQGTELLDLRPDVKTIADPYTGQPLTAFPAIGCDVAVIHVLKATPSGDCIFGGNPTIDLELAIIAPQVILTAEEIVDKLDGPADIPGYLVSHVVQAPQGAWPTSCYPLYPIDGEEITRYIAACNAGEFEAYIFGSSAGVTPRNPTPMYTIDELISVCISRQIEDGELVGQGIATPLVAAGILLAKLTHAPNLYFASAIGQSICFEWAPIGVATIEQLWIKQGNFTMSFVQGVCDFMALHGPKEFFRPGQVDRYGNFNNIFMGGSYKSPRLRLPGSGGIPDVTVTGDHTYLYVPRHGRHTFVKELDCRSGLGHDRGRRQGRGPHYLISDLGQFDFEPESGRMRLTTIHPGVSINRLKAKTGFELLLPDPIPETPAPTETELLLLRETIDPLGVRSVETLAGKARRDKLRDILAAERESTTNQ